MVTERKYTRKEFYVAIMHERKYSVRSYQLSNSQISVEQKLVIGCAKNVQDRAGLSI
jgi:hypothetical protein